MGKADWAGQYLDLVHNKIVLCSLNCGHYELVHYESFGRFLFTNECALVTIVLRIMMLAM